MAVLIGLALLQAASTVPASAQKPANLDKVHCVKHVETGSLMVGRKECHSEAEWRVIAEEARKSAANMMNATRSNRMDAEPGAGG